MSNFQSVPPISAVQTISNTKMAIATMFLGAAAVAAAASFSFSGCSASDIIPRIALQNNGILNGLTFGELSKKTTFDSFASPEYDSPAIEYLSTQTINGRIANGGVSYFIYKDESSAEAVAKSLMDIDSAKESTPEISYTFSDESGAFTEDSLANCTTFVTSQTPFGATCLIQKGKFIAHFFLTSDTDQSFLANEILQTIGNNIDSYSYQCASKIALVRKPEIYVQNLVVASSPSIVFDGKENDKTSLVTIDKDTEEVSVNFTWGVSEVEDLEEMITLRFVLKNLETGEVIRPMLGDVVIPNLSDEDVNENQTSVSVSLASAFFLNNESLRVTIPVRTKKIFEIYPDLPGLIMELSVDPDKRISEANEENNLLVLKMRLPSNLGEVTTTIQAAEFLIPNDEVTVLAGEEYCVIVKAKYSDDPDAWVDVKNKSGGQSENGGLPEVNFAFEPIGNADVRTLTCEQGDGFGIVAPNDVGEHELTLHLVVDEKQIETPADSLILHVVEADMCPNLTGVQDSVDVCSAPVVVIDVCPDLEGVQANLSACSETKPTSKPTTGGGSSGGGGGGFVAPSAPIIEMPTVAAGTSGSLAVVQINQGVKSTANSTVTLNMPTTSADQMAISNTANFEGVSWESYKKTKSWNLTSGLGNKTVYIKFRNSKNGGVTKVYTASIELVKKVSEPKTNVTAPKPSVQCSLIPGKPYKLPNQSTIYYITSQCTKRPFKSSEVFFTYFGSWSEVQTVSTLPQNDTIQFMPWGPKYNPKSGALIKVPEDSKVYLLINGKKYWITSEPVFLGLGYQWNWVEDADVNLLNAFQTMGELSGPNVHQDGTVMKYGNSTKVYVLEGGKKRWIVNEAAFNKLGYRWDRIVTIPASEVYPDGADLK